MKLDRDCLDYIIQLDKKMKYDFLNNIYDTYDKAVKEHFDAEIKIKITYSQVKEDYENFEEFLDNEENNPCFNGFIWTNKNINLYLDKPIENLSNIYLFETIDKFYETGEKNISDMIETINASNDSGGGVDSFEILFKEFKETYYYGINKIGDDKITQLLEELLIKFYVPCLEDWVKNQSSYIEAYKDTINKISELEILESVEDTIYEMM